MAPNFALFLSPEGIALAHRQTGGHWAVLGDTPLDVADLGAALVVLRKLAEARVGTEFETFVVLPDDQVLYTSLTAPGPDEETRLWQIREGLEGLTPYAVDELVFDWAGVEDGRVKLAVVAQETLDEARDFAEGHGFTPAGFGARPLDNRFPGVAHFDRSFEWTAEIPDIEFGHDTWREAPTENAPALDSPADADAAEQGDTSDAPGDDSASVAPGATHTPPTAREDDTAHDAAPAPVDQLDTADDGAAPDTADRTDAGETASPADSAQQAVPPDSNAPQDVTPSSALDTPNGGSTAPDENQAPRRRLTLTAGQAADPSGQSPATPPDGSQGPDRPDDDAPTPPEAPLQVPAGFGAHRKRSAPETAGKLLRNRKTRFAPGAPDDTAPAVPELPRKKARGAPDREAPALGRASGDTAPPATDRDTPPEAAKTPAKKGKPAARPKPAKAKAKAGADTAADVPERPPGAGPQPELPPLARVKSKIEEQQSAAPPRPNPFDGPPPGAAKPSLRDRVAGIGRKMSGGNANPARRGSALGEKLRGLGSKAEKAPEADAPLAPPPAEDPHPQDSAKKPAKKTAKAAEDSVAQAAAAIAPPAPDPTRKPFAPPQRRAQGPAIADADAPIMGGLLARGSIATQRGPSLRGGLILTLVLLVVLALVGLWAAVYLPQTALGRWMGLGDEDEAVIIVETDPAALDQPSFDGDTPAIEDAPPQVAALPAEEGAPEAAITPPTAPELLPDIDAEDLDLGPAPVTSPVIDPEMVLPSEEENANFYARTGIWQRAPVITQPEPETRLEEVIFVGLDPVITSLDAYALPEPDFDPAADLPRRQSNPLSPETQLALGEDGLVEPSEEGTLNPDGILVYAGPPAVLPQPRPGDAPAALAAAEAEAEAAEASTVPAGAVETALLRAVRPETRPEDLVQQRERAVLGGITYDELAAIRPEERPQSLQEAAAAEAAANTQPGDIEDASTLAVAVSFVPRPRPGDIEALVEEARAADPPAAANGSDTIEPEIPSSASVTRAATEENAINLRDVNLIGVSGTSSQRRALVRLPSGRFVTVEVGDRLDGGQVAAIGESSLQYVKRGRTITLDVPTG